MPTQELNDSDVVWPDMSADILWKHITEIPSVLSNTSEFYGHLNLQGMRTAVIGPYYLPYDPLALQLAHCVGRDGTVFSVDPLGDSFHRHSYSKEAVGSGNSSIYKRQLDILSSYGFSLGDFNWLGPDSSLISIPEHGRNLDGIFDNGTLEFISQVKSVAYMRKGVETLTRSLRSGGIWVHHSNTEHILDTCREIDSKDNSFNTWADQLPFRFWSFEIESPEYRIPASKSAINRFIKDSNANEIIELTSEARKLIMTEAHVLIFPRIVQAYPQRYIHVAQKI